MLLARVGGPVTRGLGDPYLGFTSCGLGPAFVAKYGCAEDHIAPRTLSTHLSRPNIPRLVLQDPHQRQHDAIPKPLVAKIRHWVRTVMIEQEGPTCWTKTLELMLRRGTWQDGQIVYTHQRDAEMMRISLSVSGSDWLTFAFDHTKAEESKAKHFRRESYTFRDFRSGEPAFGRLQTAHLVLHTELAAPQVQEADALLDWFIMGFDDIDSIDALFESAKKKGAPKVIRLEDDAARFATVAGDGEFKLLDVGKSQGGNTDLKQQFYRFQLGPTKLVAYGTSTYQKYPQYSAAHVATQLRAILKFATEK